MFNDDAHPDGNLDFLESMIDFNNTDGNSVGGKKGGRRVLFIVILRIFLIFFQFS